MPSQTALLNALDVLLKVSTMSNKVPMVEPEAST